MISLRKTTSGIELFRRRRRIFSGYQLSGEHVKSLMPGCLLLIIFPALAAVTGFIVYHILI
jgi:hypothetical protein